MSRKLVIHIGAQKCASSSLQASLDLLAEAVKDDFGFCHLKPELLRMASQALDRNEDSAFDYLDEVLRETVPRLGQLSTKAPLRKVV